jgi:hypothetical protein
MQQQEACLTVIGEVAREESKSGHKLDVLSGSIGLSSIQELKTNFLLLAEKSRFGLGRARKRYTLWHQEPGVMRSSNETLASRSHPALSKTHHP